MNEGALVSLIALLGWLFLIWRSGALRNISNNRKMTIAAVWVAIFAAMALLFRAAA